LSKLLIENVKYRIGRAKIMQVVVMKTKLEERIRALEKEKSLLLEEVKQLKELVELSEKSKALENEVNKLKSEVKALKEKIPREFLQELGELESSALKEDDEGETLEEECPGCEEEELL
jgi:peptidoglycan hydrolase CwlO-like protein